MSSSKIATPLVSNNASTSPTSTPSMTTSDYLSASASLLNDNSSPAMPTSPVTSEQNLTNPNSLQNLGFVSGSGEESFRKSTGTFFDMPFKTPSFGVESSFVGLASLINPSDHLVSHSSSHNHHQPSELHQQQHQCGICRKEPMVDGKTLVGCWHSFCHTCLNQAFASGHCQIQTSLNGLGSSMIICPVCSQVI